MTDPEHDLVRFGVRDYLPSVGTWTAKDPVLFGDTPGSVFKYVDNAPVDSVDWSGMFVFFGEGPIVARPTVLRPNVAPKIPRFASRSTLKPTPKPRPQPQTIPKWEPNNPFKRIDPTNPFNIEQPQADAQCGNDENGNNDDDDCEKLYRDWWWAGFMGNRDREEEILNRAFNREPPCDWAEDEMRKRIL